MSAGHLRIADETFTFERATFVGYHCASEIADWNLGLAWNDTMLWLSGTIEPAPGSPEAIDGAVVTVDLRSLDELAEALLGRAITMYPGGQSVCALSFALRRTPAGVRLEKSFTFEWDAYLETFEEKGTTLEGDLRIDAAIEALHPGHLPG